MINLGIAIPCHGQWQADFGLSLALMIAELASTPGISVGVSQNVSSLLPKQRTWLAKDLLSKGATHILWLDTDMAFPPDTAECLLAHDLNVVGVNYARKYHPFLPTARGLDGEHIQSYGKTGIEPASSMGLGVCLMKAELFHDLPEPWFPISWSEERGGYIGEDIYFFHHLAREKNVSLWIDHSLSNRIDHIGTFRYGTQMSHLAAQETQLGVGA